MKSPFGYLGTHGFFLLFCAGIIVIVFFSLSSLQLAADGDAMFQLKFQLINSAPLHGSHVVCELLSTNCFPDNCAYVFDFKLQLICCGKEFGVCRFSLWPLPVPLALLLPIRPKHLWTQSLFVFCIYWGLIATQSRRGMATRGAFIFGWCWAAFGHEGSCLYQFLKVRGRIGIQLHCIKGRWHDIQLSTSWPALTEHKLILWDLLQTFVGADLVPCNATRIPLGAMSMAGESPPRIALQRKRRSRRMHSSSENS